MIKSGRSKGRFFLLVILCIVLHAGKVEASGGEELEGSVLEKYLVRNGIGEGNQLFEGFEEMDYALFLETNVGYGVTLDYYKYGIYGDFTQTAQDGEKVYFQLNEKLLGKEMELSTHNEWADYVDEHIVFVSPDLEWSFTREFADPSLFQFVYTERWYQMGKQVKELNEGKSIVRDMRQFVVQKTASGGYGLMAREKVWEVAQMLQEVYFVGFGESDDKWICFDEYGQLLATVEPIEENGSIYNVYEEPCIRIYDISKPDIAMLYELPVPEMSINWPIEISQIVGDEKEGWLVFSAGDTTYRMNYPEGETEIIGEFMYGTTYSPDGRYRAYCTGHDLLFESWECMERRDLFLYHNLREKWDAIEPGWYVEELETGNKTYIPIELWTDDIDRPLYGGRCIWVEKDKLLQILNQ